MKNTFLLFTFLTMALLSFAQEGNHPKIDEYKIASKIYEGTRLVSVSTPVGYNEKDKKTSYLVAYLFDGQFTPYFNMVNSAIQYYSQVGEGVPMIVISIHSENRSLEFTPKANHEKTIESWEGQCGEAEKLTKFIREEVIPQVESKYNVKPYRLGIGHSLGGTYVLTELMKTESLFNSVIAVSPNMVYDKEQLVDQGKNHFAAAKNSQAFIYCSAGDQGEMENSFRKSLERLDSIAQKELPENMTWHYEYLEGDSHMSTFLPTFDNGYLKFSKHFTLSEIQGDNMAKGEHPIEDFHQFFKNMSQFAGFEISPSNNDYNNYAYTLDYFKLYKEADVLLEIATQRFPEDANLYDTRGEILENSGDAKKAHLCYQNALKTLEKYKENYDKDTYEYSFKTFKTNADRTAVH